MRSIYINKLKQGAMLSQVILRIFVSINSGQIGGCSASSRGGGADIPSAEGENTRPPFPSYPPHKRRKTRRSRARYLDSILSLLHYYRIILKRGSLANCRGPLSFSFSPLSHCTIPPFPLGHAEHA